VRRRRRRSSEGQKRPQSTIDGRKRPTSKRIEEVLYNPKDRFSCFLDEASTPKEMPRTQFDIGKGEPVLEYDKELQMLREMDKVESLHSRLMRKLDRNDWDIW